MRNVRWIVDQDSTGADYERKVECNDATITLTGSNCFCDCIEPGWFHDTYYNECRQCSPGCYDCNSNCSCNFCYSGWEYDSEGKCACTAEDHQINDLTGECEPVNNSIICEYDTYEISGVCEPCNTQCQSCSGPGANECLSCVEPLVKTAVGTGFKCECPTGTVWSSVNSNCYDPCHLCSANACSTTGCTACIDGAERVNG